MGYKIFVAGSQALINERDACRSVCSQLQNKWGTIITKTFEDFPVTMSEVGHQKEYNNFIEKKADMVLFIFSGSVGNFTREEYDHAYSSFKASGHPKIIVYFDKKGSDNEAIMQFKEELGANDHYYQEYASLGDLKKKVKDHINNALIAKHKSAKKTSLGEILGVPALFVGIWLLLSLIGGVGMYIFDRNMSEKTCRELAVKYAECVTLDFGNPLVVYNFPDETFIYDINEKSLSVVPRSNDLPSHDFNRHSITDVTLSATVSLLLVRAGNFKVKGNPKTVAACLALAACVVIGCGAGCLVEQMIFPPQYSDNVREYLMVEENWEHIVAVKGSARIF